MAQPGQEPGRGQPLGAAADNRRPLARGRGLVGLQPLAGLHLPVGDEPLDRVDGHRLVGQVTPTGRFAGMGANSAADQGERIALLDGQQSLAVVALTGPP